MRQGTGVQYKLINAGLSIKSNDVTSSQQAFTIYSRYWFGTIMRLSYVDGELVTDAYAAGLIRCVYGL